VPRNIMPMSVRDILGEFNLVLSAAVAAPASTRVEGPPNNLGVASLPVKLTTGSGETEAVRLPRFPRKKYLRDPMLPPNPA